MHVKTRGHLLYFEDKVSHWPEITNYARLASEPQGSVYTSALGLEAHIAMFGFLM